MKIRNVALKIGVLCLRAVYIPIRLRKKKNRITFISRQSNKESIDITLLRDYFVANNPEIEVRVMVRYIESGMLSKLVYAFHILSQMNAIATSKVVVIDGYCIAVSILKHSSDTKIIQMWHSMAAIKQFGKQILDREAGHSRKMAEIMCMHKNYDYVICPSERTGALFCKGFGCSRDKLREYCLPRIDYIQQQNSIPAGDDSAKLTGKETLLYAPTFRKNEGLRIKELLESIDYSSFTLVVKPHPLYQEEFKESVEELGLQDNVIVDNKKSTFEWLGICDRVISDYSAVAVESLVTKKPLYFYVYDLDEYNKKTGLNFNPAIEVPSITAGNAEDLRALLGKEYDWQTYERFREDYLTADTNNCTEKLAQFIIEVANGKA